MKRKAIILDYDDTIVNSKKCVVQIYNTKIEEYNRKNGTNLEMTSLKEVIHYDWRELRHLDKLGITVQEIFESEEFFKKVQFFPYAKEKIEELCKTDVVKICTVGSKRNNELKMQWFRDNLPCIDLDNNYIWVDLAIDKEYNKSLVNMQDSIFVDDKAINLSRVSDEELALPKDRRRVGILFKQKDQRFEWQENWNGYETYCWRDLEYTINLINNI